MMEQALVGGGFVLIVVGVARKQLWLPFIGALLQVLGVFRGAG